MPKSFLVKKATRRHELGEEESIASSFDSAYNSLHRSTVSREAMLNGKQHEDTPRRLHNHSGDNTSSEHEKDIPNATRSEQIFDPLPRISATGERLRNNWQVMPHRMLFFPPYLTQGNFFAECCVPTSSKLQEGQEAQTSEGGHSLPEFRNEPRIDSVLKVNSDRKTPDDVKSREPASNDNSLLPWHLDSTSSIWLPTSNGLHSLPKLTFPNRKKNGECCGIYSFDQLPSQDVFDSLKRKRMEKEWERLSAKSVRLLENLDLPEAKRRKRERGSVSPENVRNSMGHRNNEERCCSHREAKPQNSEDKTNLEKDSNSVVKNSFKRHESSREVITNGMESEQDSTNIFYRNYPDWHVSVPYLNSARLADRIFNYSDQHSVRERTRSTPSSVWIPEHLKTMSNEEAGRVLNGFHEKDAWKSEMNRENGFLCDAREKKETLSLSEVDVKTIASKISSENHKGWLQDDQLSPKLVREGKHGDKRAEDTIADEEDRMRSFQKKSREQELNMKNKSRSYSPDHSIIKTSASNLKEQNTKTFSSQNVHISEPFSTMTERRESETSPVSLGSPERISTNSAVTETKKFDFETLRLPQDAKSLGVEKPNGKVFSDHSTLWLLNRETKTPQVSIHPKLPVPASSPPFWVSANGGFGVRPQLSMLANNTSEDSRRISSNTTHNHRCEICNSTFPLRRLLNRHLKTHSFYKRYTCSYCDKGFNDTFDLKRHVRTHTGVKPFKCEKCDKSFTQRCSLEAHQTRVHGMVHKFGFRERRSKMFVCEDCGATFRDNQSEFMNHVASMHPDREKTPWAKKNSRLCSRVVSF
ncbi:hypothetical protein ACROYT_G028203 [Oculina patagonica]